MLNSPIKGPVFQMWTMDGKSKMAALVMVVAAVACIVFCTFVALCPMGSLCESRSFLCPRG